MSYCYMSNVKDGDGNSKMTARFVLHRHHDLENRYVWKGRTEVDMTVVHMILPIDIYMKL